MGFHFAVFGDRIPQSSSVLSKINYVAESVLELVGLTWIMFLNSAPQALGSLDMLLTQWHIFFFPLKLCISVPYICRKRIPESSSLCVFFSLLHGPWCQLRSSVQWSWSGRTEDYSAISHVFELYIQSGADSFTYVTCPGSSGRCSQFWFSSNDCKFTSVTQFHHHS